MTQHTAFFSYVKTPDEAITAPGEFRAGGTDLSERRHTGISQGALIDIQGLAGLRSIKQDETGSVQIGTLVSVAKVATDPILQRDYPGLSLAAGGLATPQIRSMATIGGCLLQKTRCWYYRHPAFSCYKKGGASCPAREGDHHHGVCFDDSACVYPHPSTLGMALLAYEAQVTVHGQEIRSIAKLYGDGTDPTRDNLLATHELVTHILLPPPKSGEQAVYFRAISRAAAEWPLVEVIVRVIRNGDHTVRVARVCVGGVAPVPLRLFAVEEALQGKTLITSVLESAALRAADGAKPLPQTKYKVELLTRTVLEALERVARQS